MIIYPHPCQCGKVNKFEIEFAIGHIVAFDTCPKCNKKLDFVEAALSAYRDERAKDAQPVTLAPDPPDPLRLDKGDKARPS